MKLDEYLAKAFSRWPFHLLGTVYQTEDKWVRCTKGGSLFKADSLYEDWSGVEVDIHRFEAERERILAESSKFTESDKEHIADLTAIACGKRSKEDQALWDKVAADSLQSYLNLCDLSGAVEKFAERAANIADAFMAERTKRMKG